MRLLAAVFLLQSAPAERVELASGLETLYAGQFGVAAAYFAALAARDTTDPAPVIFQAGSYIWWAAAREDDDFERRRVDSLLATGIRRAEAAGDDFWVATAYGYRARQRELLGGALGAATDAKRMRDAYRRVLAADSARVDCYLGLGLYDYGLARIGALSRFFARLLGLGSGDAERGIRYLRRAAHDGDLTRVEATWVLASALAREAARDEGGRAVLLAEARAYVARLLERYPQNPVFLQFLERVAPADRVP